MITTMVSSLVAVRARPELASQPIQLVFTDNFGLEGNHFVPMWDRMGAWPPRRLSLDPWDRACRESPGEEQQGCRHYKGSSVFG